MNEPASSETPLTPSARPRWLAGNASVMMAAELAIIMAPPAACTMRRMMISRAPVGPLLQTRERAPAATREDDQADLEHAHATVHVADAAGGDDQGRRDEPVAHEDPQQVGEVAGVERVEVDAAKDRPAARSAGSRR